MDRIIRLDVMLKKHFYVAHYASQGLQTDLVRFLGGVLGKHAKVMLYYGVDTTVSNS